MKTSLFVAAALAAGGVSFAANAQPAGGAQAPKSLVEYFSQSKKPAESEKAAKAAPRKAKARASSLRKASLTARKAVAPKRVKKRVRVSIDPTTTASIAGVAAKATAIRAVASGSAYNQLIARYAAQHGVPASLAHAVITVESNYRPNALGGAGEIGLMQIKPATARMMGYSGSNSGLYDPETNIRFGMKYLGKAYSLGGGDVCGAILRYNAGHGATRMNPVSAAYCSKVKRHLAG